MRLPNYCNGRSKPAFHLILISYRPRQNIDAPKMTNLNRQITAVFAALLTFFMTLDACAWGALGHRVIASVADTELTPEARAKIGRLLAQEPGATLASISTWPDEQRSTATAKWHFVNFPEGTCTYHAERDCPGGACVVEATQTQIGILKSAASDAEKLTALKYVVHFIGDVHQPLHAGHAYDKGGNTYQVQALGQGTNLHALWDNGLVQHLDSNEEALALKIGRMTPPPAIPSSDQMIVKAAEESCTIVGAPDFYPKRNVEDDYLKMAAPLAMDRMRTAAARLAAVLNSVFR